MINLRWIIRLKDDGNTEKVLQMRQEYDTATRVFLPGQAWELPTRTSMQWGPWVDVPTFLEEPSYEEANTKYARD